MLTHAGTIQFKALAVALVVMILACCGLDPIQAKAATPTISYQTTTMSLSAVKAECEALSAGALALILGIIGFFALTYVVARNLSVPVQYPDGAGFFDKCYTLGRYVFDNASEALTNVIYSAKVFVENNPQLGTWGAISAFIATGVGSFFGAFSAWAGSFLNPSQRTTDFINKANGAPEITYEGSIGVIQSWDQYAYPEALSNILSQADIDYNYTAGSYSSGYTYNTNTYYAEYSFWRPLINVSSLGYVAVISSNSIDDDANKTVSVRIGKIVNGYINRLTDTEYNAAMKSYILRYWQANSKPQNNLWQLEPNVATLTQSNGVTRGFTIGNRAYNGSGYYPKGATSATNILNMLIYFGYAVAYTAAGVPISFDGQALSIDDPALSWQTDLPSIDDIPATIPRDTVLTPDDLAEYNIDIDRIADTLSTTNEKLDVIIRGLEAGSTLELLKELLGEVELTLTQAKAIEETTINQPPSGIIIPSVNDVWKYPRYMFGMLGSFVQFCGQCLQAVTIGEGGLSWIFYGAFVLIVCGGVIGKILL